MLKGFDSSLASALETTREMLFTDYAVVRPERAPRHMTIGPSDADRLLSELLEMLLPSETEKLIEQAALILRASNAVRRASVDRLARKYGLQMLVAPLTDLPLADKGKLKG
jgi:hypothetical protein